MQDLGKLKEFCFPRVNATVSLCCLVGRFILSPSKQMQASLQKQAVSLTNGKITQMTFEIVVSAIKVFASVLLCHLLEQNAANTGGSCTTPELAALRVSKAYSLSC
jgi:hypothetical protein